MKKVFIAIAILLAIGVIAFFYLDFNRIGAENYYLKVTKDGKAAAFTADDGQKFMNYKYQLTGYKDDGTPKKLEFTAQKNLRKKAYLKIFYKKGKGVTSYEEVKQKEIPTKAAKQLD
ncbi:YxeA family protein [Listeria sp. PSOL-1]|uniref:YxeA family protein n=1 Tax=Listeria sp. PSOL-1 TaxID=1844999 RepID=UPI0013D6F4FA|nr:YxeA family protein [Listeria sp. PSOL-1]